MFLRILFSIILSIWIFTAAQSKPILILQDQWGGITGLDISLDQTAMETLMVRPVLNSPLPGIIDFELTQKGGGQLLGNGMLFPVGKARISSGMLHKDVAVGMALLPNGNGGWVATQNYIKSIGMAPSLVVPAFTYPIRDVEYDPVLKQLAVLLSNGHITICGPSESEWNRTVNLSRDEAIDLEQYRRTFFVLTKNGTVYQVFDANAKEANEIELPKLEQGRYLDFEIMPSGRGMILLDSNGILHSVGGAPRIPVQPVSAIDMELAELDSAPFWFPMGWNTAVSFKETELRLDPLGPKKQVTVNIQNAENMLSFSTEIHYDPAVIRVDPLVSYGQWWKQNMSYPKVDTQVFSEREGVLYVYGRGYASTYGGASGSGELLHIEIAVHEGVENATTTLQLKEFNFIEASPLNLRGSAEITGELPIRIYPSQPKISLAWVRDNTPVLQTKQKLHPGEVARVDLAVHEGSRIHQLHFDMQYSPGQLRYLGMTKGNVWYPNSNVQADFPLPSRLRQPGHLRDIRLTAKTLGACRDEPGSLVTVLFQKRQHDIIDEQAHVEINSLTMFDYNSKEIVAELGANRLYLK